MGALWCAPRPSLQGKPTRDLSTKTADSKVKAIREKDTHHPASARRNEARRPRRFSAVYRSSRHKPHQTQQGCFRSCCDPCPDSATNLVSGLPPVCKSESTMRTWMLSAVLAGLGSAVAQGQPSPVPDPTACAALIAPQPQPLSPALTAAVLATAQAYNLKLQRLFRSFASGSPTTAQRQQLTQYRLDPSNLRDLKLTPLRVAQVKVVQP